MASKPNYFTAIEISNEMIRSKVAEVQEKVCQESLTPPWNGFSDTAIFKDAMVQVEKLHFTLNVMHLKGQKELEIAQLLLAEVCSEVHEEFHGNPVVMTVEGIGTFGNKVYFAEVKERPFVRRLARLHDMFQRKFHERLNLRKEEREYHPHLTIANIAKSRDLKYKGISTFPSQMWSSHMDTFFGKQKVTGIQLLEMRKDSPQTGYYVSHGQYNFY